ncbi:energy-coupling factor transporter transmembrane component T [Curtanaerobium respiraculi]|uniref:energy-coupling factor transporter transmembrane component T n=1 Tax=Curtanaerobium respiraculi TaxID=2949669 RepID=UPI0024B38538|nr:energy-coupling factor transporter transmembrane component T [Curtanaerobium respiraculi]
MDLFTYGDDSKNIIKLDSRTKLLVFVMSSVLSLSNYQLVPQLLFGAFLCALLVLSGKRAEGLKLFALQFLLLFTRECILTSGIEPGVVGNVLNGLVLIGIFFFPIMASFLLIVQTTHISDFLAAFQRMHLPVSVVIPIAVFFRFVPTVQEEWAGISKAMAFRGIRTDPFAIVTHPMCTIEYILIPMLFSSMSVMEELASAAIARGLDSEEKRSAYETVRLRWVDYLTIAALAIFAIIIFATKGAL